MTYIEEGLTRILAESSSRKMPVYTSNQVKTRSFNPLQFIAHHLFCNLMLYICILSELQKTSKKKKKNRDERSASRSVRFHLLVQMFSHPINRKPLCLETVWMW
jgi:hypothetical protein